MSDFVTVNDNSGDWAVPPHPHASNPELATGQTLTDAATGGDETATVEQGHLYAFTCRPAPVASGNATDITFVFGLAAITTAANIVWVCTPGNTILIQIPQGYTTLHYMSLANSGSGYLRKLQ